MGERGEAWEDDILLPIENALINQLIKLLSSKQVIVDTNAVVSTGFFVKGACKGACNMA